MPCVKSKFMKHKVKAGLYTRFFNAIFVALFSAIFVALELAMRIASEN